MPRLIEYLGCNFEKPSPSFSFLTFKKGSWCDVKLGRGSWGQGQQCLQSMEHGAHQSCHGPTCTDCGVAKAEHFVVYLNFWAFSPGPPSSLGFLWGTEALSMPTFQSVTKGTTPPPRSMTSKSGAFFQVKIVYWAEIWLFAVKSVRKRQVLARPLRKSKGTSHLPYGGRSEVNVECPLGLCSTLFTESGSLTKPSAGQLSSLGSQLALRMLCLRW